MESLQIAQILADLSDLQNTEPSAASALLSTHTLPQPARTQSSPSSSQTINPSQNQASSSQPSKFDRLGRRILSPSPRSAGTGTGTPPLIRTSSSNLSTFGMPPGRVRSYSGSTKGRDSVGSMSPGGESEQIDPDLYRAKTLLELFEQRGRFKQMGDTGLLRSKERVDDVATRYAKRDLEEKEKALRSKYLSPKT